MFLKISNLTKFIGKNLILDDITIDMDRGSIYGLRGKNGSGKTMLMRAICGLIIPTKGSITINGELLNKDISFPRSIGALIESPGFIASYSGLKNLEMLASIQKKIRTNEIMSVMSELGLDPLDKKIYKKYSLGMKQKLGIAAALMENPDIIILDEPTNALDEKGVEVLRVLLTKHKNNGALIIISCHDKEELEFLSDEIFCIENGKITNSYIVPKKEGETIEEN